MKKSIHNTFECDIYEKYSFAINYNKTDITYSQK